MTTALSLAPSSPLLSLLHLRHLLRTTAPHSSILSFAQSLTKSFGSSPTPLTTREEIWVARLETVVALEPIEKVSAIFTEAIKSLPFSGKIWSIQASFIERSGTEDVSAWYQRSIKRCLLSDAVPPIGFESKFEDGIEPPREFLPRSYLTYLRATAPESITSILTQLILESPTLSMHFLSYALQTVPKSNKKESKLFREMIYSRIIDASPGASEFVAFGEELLRTGEIEKSNDIMRRARRTLKGAELSLLDQKWSAVCDA